MTLFILDCETGGLNPLRHSLSSVTLKHQDKIKTWFIKPYGKEYDARAIAVNGLTKEWLIINGQPLEVVFLEIFNFITENITQTQNTLYQKHTLAGHNVQFDVGFMKELFSSFGKNFMDYFDYHFIDTMHLAQSLNFLGFTNFKSFKLVNVYTDLFGEDELSRNAHKSENDVLMTEKALNKFKEFRK